MRLITKESVDAFLSRTNYKKQNMRIANGCMYLYDHKIAWFDLNGQLWISHCGYRTNTTKERLNGLPGVDIRQRNYQWYVNGEEWNSCTKCIGKVL